MARLWWSLSPSARLAVLLGGVAVALAVLVFGSRGMADSSQETGRDGPSPQGQTATETAAGSPSPTAAPESSAVTPTAPSAPTPTFSAPSEADLERAQAVAATYLKSVQSWSYPVDVATWRTRVSGFVRGTSPYLDLLLPSMSLSMARFCAQDGCEQSAVVTPVGPMRALANGGYRGRFSVTTRNDFSRPNTAVTLWEVELFGNPPAVNSAFVVDPSPDRAIGGSGD